MDPVWFFWTVLPGAQHYTTLLPWGPFQRSFWLRSKAVRLVALEVLGDRVSWPSLHLRSPVGFLPWFKAWVVCTCVCKRENMCL